MLRSVFDRVRVLGLIIERLGGMSGMVEDSIGAASHSGHKMGQLKCIISVSSNLKNWITHMRSGQLWK